VEEQDRTGGASNYSNNPHPSELQEIIENTPSACASLGSDYDADSDIDLRDSLPISGY